LRAPDEIATTYFAQPNRENGCRSRRRIRFASDKEYLAGVGHRTAALEDSRLLPLVEAEIPPAND
jgi:hypothetical protein